MENKMKLLYLILPLVLISCSYMPEPLDNPKVSYFGKKCGDGMWSYVWIYDRDKELRASKENCK